MRRLAIFAFAFAAGAFVCAYFLPADALLYTAAGLAVLAALTALLLRSDNGRRTLFALLGLLCAVLRMAVFGGLQLAPARALCTENEELCYTVTDYSRSTDYGVRAEAKLDGVKTMLYLKEDTELCPGDRVTVSSRVELSTGDDGENTTFRAKSILLTAYAKGESQTKKAEKLSLRYYPQYAAKRLSESFDENLPGETAKFMKALILGDKSELSDDTYADLKDSGLSHVVAVSGLHISFLVAAIMRLRLHRKARAAVCIPVLIFFMFMTGCTPSVTRAVIMSVMLLLAPLFGRESDNATTLGLSLLIILLINPYAIQSLSLQLSYAAVIGIFAFSGRLEGFFAGVLHLKNRKRTSKRALSVIAGSVSISMAATVFTLPLSAYYFGSIAILAPISNVLVTVVVSVLFPLGLFGGAVGIFLPAVGTVIGYAVHALSVYVLFVAKIMAALPFGKLAVQSAPMLAWLVFAYCVFAVMCLSKGWSRRWYIPVACVVITLCVLSVANSLYYDAIPMTFTVLDVGQGQSIVVTAGKETVIIDSGGDRYGAADAVENYLLSIGRTSADALILTHFHDDHAEYAPKVISRVGVSTVIAPESGEPEELEKEIVSAARKNGAELLRVSRTTKFTLGDVAFTVFPPMQYGVGNEACLSCLISCGDWDALVTGDMPASAERALIDGETLPDTELLVVGHHGSKYSTCGEFLDAVKPDTAIISVSGDNSYGHPTKETLKRLGDRNIEIFRTDKNGTVTVTVREGQ